MREKVYNAVEYALLHEIKELIFRSFENNIDINNFDNIVYKKYNEKKINLGFDLESIVFSDLGKRLEQDLDLRNLYYLNELSKCISLSLDNLKNDSNVEKKSLESIFNILNGNSDKKYFHEKELDIHKINLPNYDSEKNHLIYEDLLNEIGNIYKDNYEIDKKVNYLLNVMEKYLTFSPVFNNNDGYHNISMYDYLKITAAISSCILIYLEDIKKYENIEKDIYRKRNKFFSEKAFLLYSIDISGIQNFIYTISSKAALKGLRARSFYLEIVMECFIDELLEKLELSRTNLIYYGGGHSYFLLPNTKKVKKYLEEIEKEINNWYMDNFDISLFMAGGYVECSANDLQNIPEGSYEKIFIDVSNKISKKKASRYSYMDIIKLNSYNNMDGKRECVICRKDDRLDDENRCRICSKLINFSKDIFRGEYYIILENATKKSINLPFNSYLASVNMYELEKIKNSSEKIKRIYTKNNSNPKENTNLWVGTYSSLDTFEEFAKNSEGIERIAVLRADVDNLGTAFISGYKRKNGENYATISRAATFSRYLSIFFKGYINSILENGIENYFSANLKRNVAIVYSGGDDLFLVGSWNDIIDSAIDINNFLRDFTQGTLSISGGIGLYSKSHPIISMAREVEELVDISKSNKDKDSITLFDREFTFKWEKFINGVLREKYLFLEESLGNNSNAIVENEIGKNFLYNILNLIKNTDDKINIARYIYLLSRLEPIEKEKKAIYTNFSRKMFSWVNNIEDKRELILAIYLYIYIYRTREEN